MTIILLTGANVKSTSGKDTRVFRPCTYFMMSNYTPTACVIKRTLETILVFLVFSGHVLEEIFRFLRSIVLPRSSLPPHGC